MANRLMLPLSQVIRSHAWRIADEMADRKGTFCEMIIDSWVSGASMSVKCN
jgi:hypothetical protein